MERSAMDPKANGRLSDADRLVDASTWTNNIYASKHFACNVKHALQMLPVSDVCLLEDCFGGGLRVVGMVGHEFLGFGSKG